MVGWWLIFVWLGVVALAGAVAAASFVVPQLGRSRELEQEQHIIYFGHVRSWRPEALAERLSTLSEPEEVAQLSVQLTRTAAGNWRKYVLLRVVVVSALVGALLLVLAFAWPR